MERRWLLVLGASSGFGAATCRAFAGAGYDVFGVHLDRRSTIAKAHAVVADVEAAGRLCHLFNVNAADDGKRASVVAEIRAILEAEGGTVQVLLHSLAFGSLLPFIDPDGGRTLSAKQLTMTLEVMAHSLVWWTRDLVADESMGRGGRIFAMTSSGSQSAWPTYGAVSAAKAALESHVRQLAHELAPLGITANSVMAGVTHTPALEKIPGFEGLIDKAIKKNPHQRLTRPEDVAACLVELSRPGTYWLNGGALRVDGGEEACG